MAETKDDMKVRMEAEISGLNSVIHDLSGDKEDLVSERKKLLTTIDELIEERDQLVKDGDALNEKYQALVNEMDSLKQTGSGAIGFDADGGDSAWLDVPDASDGLTKVQAYYIGQTGKHGVMIRTISRDGDIDIKTMAGVKCRDNGDGSVNFVMA